MFHFIKTFFVEALVAVGIMTAPVTVTPQEIPLEEPVSITQELPADNQEKIVENEKSENKQTPVQATTKIIQTQPPTVTIDEPADKENESTVEEIADTVEDTGVVLNKQNARCGLVNGQKVTEEPTNRLCSVGEAGIITKDGNVYVWECAGINGGDSRSCRTPIVTDAVCGDLANTIVPKDYNKDKLCAVGQYSNIKEIGGQLSWSCSGVYGGKSNSCYATKALTESDIQKPVQETLPAINGVCGYAQNQTYDYMPSSGLCSAGTSTSVTKGTSTYYWSCNGNYGGSTSKCTAEVYIKPTITIPKQCAGLSGTGYILCLSQYSTTQ